MVSDMRFLGMALLLMFVSIIVVIIVFILVFIVAVVYSPFYFISVFSKSKVYAAIKQQ